MDFFGIGIQEILFILVIALIIFGPKDIVKAGQTAGKFLRKLITSSSWQTIQKTSRDLRNLPNKLMRDAGLDEVQQDIDSIAKLAKPGDELSKISKEIREDLNQSRQGLSAWTTPQPTPGPIPNPEESPSPSQNPATPPEDS